MTVESNRAGDLARRDVFTCASAERIGGVRARSASWEECGVVNGRGILLGTLAREHLDQPDDAVVEDVMALAPTTVRPDRSAKSLKQILNRTKASAVWVTTPEGELIGVVSKAAVEEVLGAARCG
jgi:Mg/Co/Ni transporter MgtE